MGKIICAEWTLLVIKEIYGVLEKCQPVTGGGVSFAGPSRVMRWVDESFRVRHKTENASGCVAYSCDIGGRAVWVVGIGDFVVASVSEAITQRKLVISF